MQLTGVSYRTCAQFFRARATGQSLPTANPATFAHFPEYSASILREVQPCAVTHFLKQASNFEWEWRLSGTLRLVPAVRGKV